MSSCGEAGWTRWDRVAPGGLSKVPVVPTSLRSESSATPPNEDDGQDEGRDPAANRDNPEGDGRGLRWIYEGGDRGDEARRFQGVTEGHIDCLVRIIIRHSIGFVGQGDLMDDAVGGAIDHPEHPGPRLIGDVDIAIRRVEEDRRGQEGPWNPRQDASGCGVNHGDPAAPETCVQVAVQRVK